MGQSQAYKRRHPGRQGQIYAQEYAGLTFRRTAIVRIEEARQRGQAAGCRDNQERPGLHSSQGRSRKHRHSEAGQARGRAQGQAGQTGRHSRSDTHHTQQAEPHSTQGKRGSRGTRRARGQATGNTGTGGTILNMRHTETSNCAIVLAWQESERGRARHGAPRPTSSQRETVDRLSLLFCLQTPTRAVHPASAARLRYYPGPLRPAARGRPGSSPDMSKNFFPISLRLPQNPSGRRQKPWEII